MKPPPPPPPPLPPPPPWRIDEKREGGLKDIGAASIRRRRRATISLPRSPLLPSVFPINRAPFIGVEAGASTSGLSFINMMIVKARHYHFHGRRREVFWILSQKRRGTPYCRAKVAKLMATLEGGAIQTGNN